MGIRVLLVEIPQAERGPLEAALWRAACDVSFVGSQTLRHVLAIQPPDLVVVDADDDRSAETLARDAPGVPVVALGAPDAVLAAFQAVFPPLESLVLDDAVLDLTQRVARRQGQEVPLTATEVNLLRFLAANAGRAVPVAELRQKVWAYAPNVQSRAVQNTVYRLRRKVEIDAAEPRHLLSTYGAGYRLVLGPVDDALSTATPDARVTLPAPRDAFVGRRADLEALGRLLDEGRLVTLTGPGGSGKTRLALTLGQARATETPWPWVDLTTAASIDDVLLAVAGAVHIPLPARDPALQIQHVLAERGEMVLLLDNVEHVVDAVATLLPPWLDACPALRVLATSRRPLHVVGEQRWPVAPLSLPAEPSLEALATSEAAALFVARARARDPAFAIDADNLGPVCELLRLVDGLPLALELAAARVGTETPERLVAGLQRSIDAWEADERDRPDRHRSLRGSLDWSWSLLQSSEQRALAALALFEGSATRDAAEAMLGAVCAPEALGPLLEASLLSRLPNDRFGMLMSVQRYAREQLAPAAEAHARDHHAQWFAEAEATWPDVDNLLDACRHAIAMLDGTLASAILLRTWQLVHPRGLYGTVLELVQGIVQLDPAPADLAEVHLIAIAANRRLGQMNDALRHCDAATAAADRAGNEVLRARAIGSRGACHYDLGAWKEAFDEVHTAYQSGRALGEAQIIAVSALNLSNLVRDDLPKSESWARESRAAYAAAGDRSGEAQALATLATAFAQQGRLDEAEAAYREGLTIVGEIDDRRTEALILSNLGAVASDRGDLERAVALVELALARAREVGLRRAVGTHLGALGYLRMRQGDPRAARDNLEAAIAIARDVADARREGKWLATLGRLHAAEGRPRAAAHCFDEAAPLLSGPALVELEAARARLAEG